MLNPEPCMQVLFDAVQSLFMVVGAILLVVIAVPWVLPVLLPLLIGFAWCRHVYMAASRDVKRFDNITRSPVYAFVSSTLRARPTFSIEAFEGGPVLPVRKHQACASSKPPGTMQAL